MRLTYSEPLKYEEISISLIDATLGERVLISGPATCSGRLENAGSSWSQQASTMAK